MTHSPMPKAIYLERTALIDRIRHYESCARYFDEDWRTTMGDVAAHIAFAKARLDHIETVIAGSAGPV